MLVFATKVSGLLLTLDCIACYNSKLVISISAWAIRFSSVVDLEGEPVSVVSTPFDQVASVDQVKCCISDLGLVVRFLRALSSTVVQFVLDGRGVIIRSGTSQCIPGIPEHAEHLSVLGDYMPPDFPETSMVLDRAGVNTFVRQLKVLRSLGTSCVFADGVLRGESDVIQFCFSYGDTEPVTFEIDRLLFYLEANQVGEMNVVVRGLFFAQAGETTFYLAPML